MKEHKIVQEDFFILKPNKLCNLENFKEWNNYKKLKQIIKTKTTPCNNCKILYEQRDKCETPYQELALFRLFPFFPGIECEKWFFDKKNKKSWRADIAIGKIIIELDGKHHRYNDERFSLDECKDTFLFKKGYYVFRRSNNWLIKNYNQLPEIILEFMNNHKQIL